MSSISQFSCVGFSGSRSLSDVSRSALAAAASSVSPSASVVVGCAGGVDEFFRSKFPRASVFRASSFGVGRSSFARRSVAVVSAVRSAGGCWVSFPSSSCPAGLVPSSLSSRCFSGGGSGSWASLAFALGCGVPCFVCLPSGVSAPAGWGLSPVGGGWFVSSPVPAQLSLF